MLYSVSGCKPNKKLYETQYGINLEADLCALLVAKMLEISVDSNLFLTRNDCRKIVIEQMVEQMQNDSDHIVIEF